MSTFRVKNFSEFQHFKDRRPPWIKLYRHILDQRDIMSISDRSFRVLVCCWLIASEDKYMAGNLPCVEDIAFRCRLHNDDIIKALQELKPWIDCDDIKAISARYQSDAPETERETETKADITHIQDGSRFTLKQCQAAAVTIAMTPDMIADFWAHYAAVDWIDAAGRRITNLSAAMAKWKKNAPSHGRHDNGQETDAPRKRSIIPEN